MRSTDALKIRQRLGRHHWSPPAPYDPDGWRFTHHTGTGSIIISTADHDGHDWTHASIAWNDYTPTYEDLAKLHHAVYGDGWAYQVFAPPSEHVNIHEHALHLWGRLDGRPALPDFTGGTGSI